MDPEGLAARIDIEELIWAIIQAGAPDEFLSSKAIVETPQIDTFLAQIFKTRGGDVSIFRIAINFLDVVPNLALFNLYLCSGETVYMLYAL